MSARTPSPSVLRRPLLIALQVALAVLLLPREGMPASGGVRAGAGLPNIVLILTDDQRFDSMAQMPLTRRDLGDHGITFGRAFVSNALCCPSRASILTGGYSHTTGVYDNGGPHGGWGAFSSTGDEDATIAVDLHDAGYRTGLFGKYFNHYDGGVVPAGWDRWAAFEGTAAGGAYYDYSMYVRDASGDHSEAYGSGRDDYSTNVIGHKVVEFLQATPASTPFFLYMAPFAPHGPSIPAPRDDGTFATYVQDLYPSFNEADVSDKPAYIRELEPTSESRMQGRFRRQYESLQAVDRSIDDVVDYLRSVDELSSTLFVFLSDNGEEYGEHRWHYKLVPYEESIRVPFIVRYDAAIAPSLRGSRTGAMVSNVDLAPTFADVGGISGSFDGVGVVDGVSIVPLLAGSDAPVRTSLLLEHHHSHDHHDTIPSYCGIRTSRYVYVRYDTGEEELYDVVGDPFELENRAASSTTTIERLRADTRELCQPVPPGFTWDA